MPLIEQIEKSKILTGRLAVDAYRTAHIHLYDKGWYKGISEDHTPLLKKLIADLEKIGITSAELDFEPKKNEISAKLWADSDLLNLRELCLEGKELTERDRIALEEKWR